MRSKTPNAARTRERQTAARRIGRSTPAEQALVAAIVADQPGTTSEAALQLQAKALGLALRRDPATVRGWIAAAREKLQERAVRYVDAHAEAMEGALAAAEFDTAGKLAWQAIERLSAPGEKGAERIVEPAPRADAAQTGSGITVQIGVMLGGMRPKELKE